MELHDCIIVGGGVAGLSTALWMHRFGYTPIIVEKQSRLGGQLHHYARPIDDLLGSTTTSGEFIQRIEHQFQHAKGHIIDGQAVGLEILPSYVIVQLADGRELASRTVVIATGLQKRLLNIPGSRKKGVSTGYQPSVYSSTEPRIAVVGGGDSACEALLLLAEQGADPILVHRGAGFRAWHVLQRKLQPYAAKIGFWWNHQLTAIEGDDWVSGVLLTGPTGTVRVLVDRVVVEIGWQACAAWLPESCKDEAGFVPIHSSGRLLQQSRVFAAGDIIQPVNFSISAALGSAAHAAKSVCAFLEGRKL